MRSMDHIIFSSEGASGLLPWDSSIQMFGKKGGNGKGYRERKYIKVKLKPGEHVVLEVKRRNTGTIFIYTKYY